MISCVFILVWVPLFSACLDLFLLVFLKLAQLNEYNTRQAAIEAVMKIQYKQGKTNTAEALRVARTSMFNPAQGDRPNAQNLAIIITGEKGLWFVVEVHCSLPSLFLLSACIALKTAF